MIRVRALLDKKNGPIWTVNCQATVKEALQLMAERKVGAVVVLESSYLVGMFSERDYARHAISIKNFSIDLPVHQLMTRHVYVVTPEDTLDDCMAIMTEKNVRHLPVLDEGILIGMVSADDVVRSKLIEMDSQINDLENYLWIHLI